LTVGTVGVPSGRVQNLIVACAIVGAVAVADMAGCIIRTALVGFGSRIVSTAALADFVRAIMRAPTVADFGGAIVGAAALTDFGCTVICTATFAGNGSRCEKRSSKGCGDKRQICVLGHGVSPIQ